MNWWQRLWHRDKMEEQLQKELRFHIDRHAADLIERGMEPEEARRQATLAFGGEEQVKEECRDARGTRWLEDLAQDFRYALRTLRQRPGFAAVALVTMALGIGATTVMFTVVNGVLLKPLRYGEPEQLVAVHGHSDTWNIALFGEQRVAYPDFLDLQRECRSLEISGWVNNDGTLSEPGEAEHVDYKELASNLLSVLKVPLFRGRMFLPEEDRPGGAPVAMLGYSFWQSHYGGSPTAIGSKLVLEATRYTVVGIAAPEFRLDGNEGDVFIPLGQDTAAYLRSRQAHPVGVVGRLRPGATLGQARTELALIGRHLAAQYPDTNKERTFIGWKVRPEIESDVRSTLWLLLGAVTLVLLIATVNIASLLLARAVSRGRELAMRVALGAGRWRLVRQCLTESAVLAIAGGALGVWLAGIGLRPFVAFWPGELPRAEEVQLDWHVLAFALAVSVASGLLLGLAPALRVPLEGVDQILRGGTRTVGGSSRRLHGGFVISEIALAVVLLVSAGIFARTLLHLSSLDPGVKIHNVLTARVALSPSVMVGPARIRAEWDDILARARRVPGVEAVTIIDTVPMREGNNPIGYWTTPTEPPEKEQPIMLSSSAMPDYLKVMGIPLRQGRFFDDQDRAGHERVVVIDEVMAKQAFGGENPIGKHIWFSLGPEPWRVVGVVGHVRYWGLAGDDQAQVRAQLYYPFAQVPDRYVRRWSELMSIAVRTGVPPLSLVEPLGQVMRGAANDQVLYQVRTMERLASDSLARQRFLLLLFGVFAGLALLLACIGVYGVLAYLTNQRVPEIGLRMALGASARVVMWLVLRQSLGMILAGIGLGAAAAFAAGRMLERSVEGMQPTGPAAFAIMIPVLAVAAIAASFLPARRASRVDPVTALRQE